MPRYRVRGAIITEDQFEYKIWADDEEMAVARPQQNADEFGFWQEGAASLQIESVEEVK